MSSSYTAWLVVSPEFQTFLKTFCSLNDLLQTHFQHELKYVATDLLVIGLLCLCEAVSHTLWFCNTFTALFRRLTAFVQTNSAREDPQESQQVFWQRDIELHMKMHVQKGDPTYAAVPYMCMGS